MKKIGILGSGTVGQTLASGFIKHGYSVMIGTRDTGKLSEWKNKAGAMATVGTFAEAAAFGDILVLAAKGDAAKDVLALAGSNNLKNKTVIDTTNPIAPAPPKNGVLKFFTTLDQSLMEQLQAAFPDVHFVKSFSCIGSGFMVNPVFAGGKPSMFYCGNSEEAKSEVKVILNLFGFEPEDMGKAEAARAIEPLCMLWCIPGMLKNEWSHAFRLMR